MFSFQLGLPSMVGLRSFEDPFPRNIHDDQLHEDCTTIPPELPDSDLTQVSYLRAKTKLVFTFARALDEINRSDPMRWERVLEIDRGLRRVYNNIPEYWKLDQLSSQDSLVIVSARFTLSSILHKSLCVLHSRFLDSKDTDDRFSYSRRVCLTSAMSILRFQAIQNQKIPIENRLRSLTNYQTSLTIHDYLLAVTIITSDLFSSRNQQAVQGVPTRIEMIKALELSSQIFAQMRDQSMEAYKAADILKMLLAKIEAENRNANPLRSELHREATNMTPPDYHTGSDPSTVPIRFSQHPSRKSSNVAQILRPSYAQDNIFDDASGLDTLSSRFAHQTGEFGALTSPLPQLQPNLDWMEPDMPSVSSF